MLKVENVVSLLNSVVSIRLDMMPAGAVHSVKCWYFCEIVHGKQPKDNMSLNIIRDFDIQASFSLFSVWLVLSVPIFS